MKNNYTNTKSLTRRNAEGYYEPDDIEIINSIDNYKDDELEAEPSINDTSEDDEFFRKIEKMKKYHKTYKNKTSLTNHEQATKYLSRLQRCKNGKMLTLSERVKQIEEILDSNDKEALRHFTDLTQTLYSCSDNRVYSALSRDVEYPLECMSSFIQGTTNSNDYLRRKYYDGQIRKRTDGSTYKRKYNVYTEADMVTDDENGNQVSPIMMASVNDKYFDDLKEMLSELITKANLTDKEADVLSYKIFGYTIEDIEAKSAYSKRQIETIQKNLRFKYLKYMKDNKAEDYQKYLSLCETKYKDFQKNYENFLKKCEKKTSLCVI